MELSGIAADIAPINQPLQDRVSFIFFRFEEKTHVDFRRKVDILFEFPLFPIIINSVHANKGTFQEKSCCSFGFCPNEGGGPCPNFLSPFQKCIFGQQNESFPSNACI